MGTNAVDGNVWWAKVPMAIVLSPPLQTENVLLPSNKNGFKYPSWPSIPIGLSAEKNPICVPMYWNVVASWNASP